MKKEEALPFIINFYFNNSGTYKKLVKELKVSMETIDEWRNGINLPDENTTEDIIRCIFDMEAYENNGVLN